MKKLTIYFISIMLSLCIVLTGTMAVFAAPEDEGGADDQYVAEEYVGDDGAGQDYVAGEDADGDYSADEEYRQDEGADNNEAAEGSAEGNDGDEAGAGEDGEASDEGEPETDENGEPINAGPVVPTTESGWPIAPELVSESVLMVEVNTGAVMYAKNIDTKRYPASTTKIMTCLIALERCSMSETVTFSESAVDLEAGDSSIDAVAGEEMSMKDCLYGLMLPSGNDCANAIAEHIGGSIEGFAEIMNERAAELGCTGTHFANPHGLYNSEHYTTAEDMMKIAQVAFNNSAFVEIFSHASYTIPATNMSEARAISNTNYMIVPNSSYYNDTVVGGKTGYLPESGRCLITLAEHDEMTVITVCMFSPLYNGVFTDTQELLDYAFHGFSLSNISESESRFNYATEDARIMLDSTAQILMPSTLSLENLDSQIEFTYDMDIDEFKEASENAGITTRDGRHLYAIINYSYDGNYLGHINVLLDDNMEIPKASFATVHYVNAMWFFAGAVGVIFVSSVLFIIIRRSRPKNTRKVRRARNAHR